MIYDLFQRWSFTAFGLAGIGYWLIYPFTCIYGDHTIEKGSGAGMESMFIFIVSSLIYQGISFLLVSVIIIKENINPKFRIQNHSFIKISNNIIYKTVAILLGLQELLFLIFWIGIAITLITLI